MNCPPFARLVIQGLTAFIVLALTLSTAACAPSQSMIATLTMLPGTFTPPPPTPIPSNTPDPNSTPTATLTPAYSYPTGTTTPAGKGTQTPDLGQTTPSENLPTGSPTPNIDTPTPQITATLAATALTCPQFIYDKTVPAPDTPSNYIGRHYNDLSLPSGLVWQASGVLSESSYSYTHVTWQGREMYWIQKLVCQNNSGLPYWEIVDSLALPKLNQVTHEVYTNLCFQGEEQVPFPIAYGTYDKSQPAVTVVGNFTGWRMQVKEAWQMKDKFVPLDPKGLTCVVQTPQGGG